MDSETLRHSNQNDPRGLGFSYEKNNAPTAPSGKSVPQQHKGTALAFTYNPQNAKPDVQERSRTLHKESRSYETKHSSQISSLPQKGSTLPDERLQRTGAKSPNVRGEAVQSNIDGSSDVSSTSKESMVDEYAKESMRQKTSAFIAGSAAHIQPTLSKTSIYKTPTTAIPVSSNRAKSPREIVPSQNYETSLDHELESNPIRQSVMSPQESIDFEKKYTDVNRREARNYASDDTKRKSFSSQNAPSFTVFICFYLNTLARLFLMMSLTQTVPPKLGLRIARSEDVRSTSSGII